MTILAGWGEVCAPLKASGGKEDKERQDSREVPQLLDSPDTHVYDKAAFLSSFSTDLLALPHGASIIKPLVTTNHSCSLSHAPKKEWPVISMVKFNPIHLNMHRQGHVRTRASFITLQLLLLLCIVVCVCAWQQPRFVLEMSEKDDGSATWSAKQ